MFDNICCFVNLFPDIPDTRESDFMLENIISRTWFLEINDEHLFLAPATPFGGEGVPWDDLGMERHSGEYEQTGGSISGYRITGKGSFYIQCLMKWFRVMQKESINPVILFTRQVLSKTRLDALVTSSCQDYVFLQKFPVSMGDLYRDTDNILMAKSFEYNNQSRISLPVMRKAWKNFCSAVKIVRSSRRFFLCEERDAYILQTIGLHAGTIRSIRDAGFEWDNRTFMWSGTKQKVDLGVTMNIIAQDSVPSPDILGFVPEWYCQLAREGKINKNTKKDGDLELWRTLLGV